MRTTSTIALSILAALIPSASATPWNGTGLVRTIDSDAPNDEIGCLTSDGRWTVDEHLCGVFTAVPTGANDWEFTLTSQGAGPCSVVDPYWFTCGPNVTAWKFGVWGDNVPREGQNVLRFGQYGVFSTGVPNPPLPGDEPRRIRPYSASEPKKWAWLSFRPF